MCLGRGGKKERGRNPTGRNFKGIRKWYMPTEAYITDKCSLDHRLIFVFNSAARDF